MGTGRLTRQLQFVWITSKFILHTPNYRNYLLYAYSRP